MLTRKTATDWLAEVRLHEREGELFRAYDLARQGLDQFPDDLALKHRAVLSLASTGATRKASDELARLAGGTSAGSGPGIRAAELCSGRGLPVRLEPRDDHASGSAADDQGGAHEAVAQPHAVRARLFPRDAGTGVRRARQGVPVLRRGLPARDAPPP